MYGAAVHPAAVPADVLPAPLTDEERRLIALDLVEFGNAILADLPG